MFLKIKIKSLEFKSRKTFLINFFFIFNYFSFFKNSQI